MLAPAEAEAARLAKCASHPGPEGSQYNDKLKEHHRQQAQCLSGKKTMSTAHLAQMMRFGRSAQQNHHTFEAALVAASSWASRVAPAWRASASSSRACACSVRSAPEEATSLASSSRNASLSPARTSVSA